MESALSPLLVLVAVTAALIPLLLFLTLGRKARPVVTGGGAPREGAAEPIWRAWVEEPATSTPRAGSTAAARPGAHRVTG